RSHLYGVPLLPSTVTQGGSPITLPNSLCSQSGRCQYDDRVYPDFGPFTSYHNDNLLNFYLHPFSGLLHSAGSSDYATASPKGGNLNVLHNTDGKILYVNNPDTGELKSYQLLSQPEEQHCVPPKPETTVTVGRFADELNTQLPFYLYYSSVEDTKSKKPCSCSKTQCLKLYCECFASGEFCSNCNCNNCYNNTYHELERCKAVKAYLDKNPETFQPKIEKLTTGDVKPKHTKGCNCKRSGCLKNYCECYEAKILCSSMCKCYACKNYEESPDRKYLRNRQQCADMESILRDCASIEFVRATCACLLARAEVAERERYSTCFSEQMIIEEFGKCLEQVLQRDQD
ncbi:tesmin-like, partial [Leptodactylus fuscus]